MLIAIKKYKFYIIKTKFCRFIIKLGKLSIDLKKIKAIIIIIIYSIYSLIRFPYKSIQTV